jgi:leucyl aminopeptidase (aminopeptidase T)
MGTLQTAAHSALKHCLNLRSDESALILADAPKMDIGQAFYNKALEMSDQCTYLVLPATPYGTSLSKPAAHLMTLNDVVVLVTSHSLSHTNARRDASRKGARIASLPGITADSLIRTMDGEYRFISDTSRKIADIFTIGHEGRLTSPAGTDLTFSIVRMKGYADTGIIHESGQFSNLPAGEGCAAPVQGSTQGVLVIDGSFPIIGKISQPIQMRVQNGYVTRITGGEEAKKVRKLLERFGKPGKNIAEIGVGTNPKARLTGITLEDEKILGTAHVALGNNLSFDGKVSAHCHLDGILLKPTLVIDGKKILENGVLQV